MAPWAASRGVGKGVTGGGGTPGTTYSGHAIELSLGGRLRAVATQMVVGAAAPATLVPKG
jgi:hypothetical protein